MTAGRRQKTVALSQGRMPSIVCMRFTIDRKRSLEAWVQRKSERVSRATMKVYLPKYLHRVLLLRPRGEVGVVGVRDEV